MDRLEAGASVACDLGARHRTSGTDCPPCLRGMLNTREDFPTGERGYQCSRGKAGCVVSGSGPDEALLAEICRTCDVPIPSPSAGGAHPRKNNGKDSLLPSE